MALLLLANYKRFISPLLHALLHPWMGCRYWPTCSEYALVALRRHGLWRGGFLALKRLLRCNPWARGGIDEVPQ
jgi:putative membrane protein insertion efficiency factor